MSEGQRQNRKNKLVAAIAAGKPIAVWATENMASKRTAYRWATGSCPDRQATSLVDPLSEHGARLVHDGWIPSPRIPEQKSAEADRLAAAGLEHGRI